MPYVLLLRRNAYTEAQIYNLCTHSLLESLPGVTLTAANPEQKWEGMSVENTGEYTITSHTLSVRQVCVIMNHSGFCFVSLH